MIRRYFLKSVAFLFLHRCFFTTRQSIFQSMDNTSKAAKAVVSVNPDEVNKYRDCARIYHSLAHQAIISYCFTLHKKTKTGIRDL